MKLHKYKTILYLILLILLGISYVATVSVGIRFLFSPCSFSSVSLSDSLFSSVTKLKRSVKRIKQSVSRVQITITGNLKHMEFAVIAFILATTTQHHPVL